MTHTGWARFFARGIVGILFFMAGWWKCFELTPVGHTQRLFLEAYADTWIPEFLLWFFGLSIPVLELVAGALLLIGFRTREALIALGFILLVVTYGHALKEPLFSIQGHIFPRGLLVLAALALPAEEDRLSLDYWLGAHPRKR
ncbi:MAG: DoxX family membrane protein [Vicinamibacteria bacterium]